MRLYRTAFAILLFVGCQLSIVSSARAGEGDRDRSSFSWHKFGAAELCQSSPQVGRVWRSDFDQGWFRSGGSELTIDGGVAARHGAWQGLLKWRGRAGEHLPARGLLREAWLSWRWRNLSLRAGRGYFNWTPQPETAILFSQNARPMDHLLVRLTDLPLPLLGGFLEAENLVGYLDDRYRAIPFPMMWGMRLSWQATDWLGLEAQRSIMLGGGGRTEKFTFGDLWDIFLGQGEAHMIETESGLQYGHADTDQKFAWLLRLHPEAWVRQRLGIEDLEICVIYGGEDRFEGLVPMAPSRGYAIRAHPFSELAISYVDLGNRDDSNHWYFHKIYRSGYTYRGSIIGHPMGGEAQTWRLALFYSPQSSDRFFFGRVIRESHGPTGDWVDQPENRSGGGFYRYEMGVSMPLGKSRVYIVAGADDPWGEDRVLDRLANGYTRLGIEVWGARLGGKLGAEEVWGVWP